MRILLKVVIISLAVFAASFVVAFGYGIYLGITDQTTGSGEEQAESEPEVESARGTSGDAQDRAGETAVLATAGSAAGEPSAPRHSEAVPAAGAYASAQDAVRTLQSRDLLAVIDGQVEVDRDGFAQLDLADAIALHQALNDGDQAHTPIRMLMFAGCSLMPESERRRFADAVGAVEPVGVVTSRVYRGDFARLMYFHDDGAIYIEALQRYAAILTDAEIVSALRSFGALLVDEGADGDWRIRVRNKLGHFDPDVLMAMHDAVDDAVLGHRRYLRAELAELAAERRAAR